LDITSCSDLHPIAGVPRLCQAATIKERFAKYGSVLDGGDPPKFLIFSQCAGDDQS
jgi:hypothetical protein